jgi:hypothetical protein
MSATFQYQEVCRLRSTGIIGSTTALLFKDRKSVNFARQELYEVRQPFCPRTGSLSTSLYRNYRKYDSPTVQGQEVRQLRSTGILGSTTTLLSKDRKSVNLVIQRREVLKWKGVNRTPTPPYRGGNGRNSLLPLARDRSYICH